MPRPHRKPIRLPKEPAQAHTTEDRTATGPTSVSKGLRTRNSLPSALQERPFSQRDDLSRSGVTRIHADSTSDDEENSKSAVHDRSSPASSDPGLFLKRKRTESRALQAIDSHNALNSRKPVTRPAKKRLTKQKTDHTEGLHTTKAMPKQKKKYTSRLTRPSANYRIRSTSSPSSDVTSDTDADHLVPAARGNSGLSKADRTRLKSIKEQFAEIDKWSIDFETISSPFYSENEDRLLT